MKRLLADSYGPQPGGPGYSRTSDTFLSSSLAEETLPVAFPPPQ
jgi:hypothetical protein